MIVARRDFVRLLGMASAVGAACPASLGRTTGDLYVNGRLSLSITRPVGWHFLSIVDYHAAAQHQRLNIADPEIESVLRNPEGAPFLAVTKFDADFDDLNPCITAWDEPLDQALGSERAAHGEALDAWRHFLPELAVQVEPADIVLGCRTPATRSAWSFLFEHDSGREWRVNVRTILVMRSERVHTFHFMDGLYSPAIAESELERAAQSLTYRAA